MTPDARLRPHRALAAFCTLWILLLFPLLAPAQAMLPSPAAAGDELDVSLITIGPGEEVWERFGHNAILIDDRTRHSERLYNYGMFDFAQQDFFLNFARGRMLYRIGTSDPAEDFAMYAAEGRWIVRQQLNFTPAQRNRLREFLEWNSRPENAQYRYEYFTANCSTRVRDALDAVLGGAIRAQTIAPSRGFTYRMDTLRLMRPETLLMLGMDAGLGPFADQRLTYWDESFVPMEFMRHLRDVRVVDAGGTSVPLVASETRLVETRLAEPPDFPPRWIWQALGVGVALALLLLGLQRLRSNVAARIALSLLASIVMLACGIGGVVLLGLWTLTEHVSAWRNENLLLLNPLCLLLLPCWLGAWRGTWRPSTFARGCALAVAAFACLALFIKVFPAFIQDNALWIALLLPVHLALLLIVGQRHAGSVR